MGEVEDAHGAVDEGEAGTHDRIHRAEDDPVDHLLEEEGELALELSKRDTGRTLYILDEPTTGLHFADIELLLKVLHRLADHGNTIVVIEHNLDVIKTADWIIDLGPEGGDGGGRIIAEGTPEQVAANPESHTGRYLNPVLARRKVG
jgi:excinuclease ABC subunit A